MDTPIDPAVQAFVSAINAGDREALRAVLAPNPTMSDDGTDRDLDAWLDSEVFSANGRMDVESVSQDGLRLVATFTNDTWGSMRTAWRFVIASGQIARFETGQA